MSSLCVLPTLVVTSRRTPFHALCPYLWWITSRSTPSPSTSLVIATCRNLCFSYGHVSSQMQGDVAKILSQVIVTDCCILSCCGAAQIPCDLYITNVVRQSLLIAVTSHLNHSVETFTDYIIIYPTSNPSHHVTSPIHPSFP